MDVDMKTAKLGHPFTFRELLNHFITVWGGVAWPGKRPGFAVVIGMDHEPHFDSHDIYLLDEYEVFDMRKLIRQCGALDVKYGITISKFYSPASRGRWVGDNKNDAASRFIAEMNRERTNGFDVDAHTKRFSLGGTAMLEMENLYPYILPQIKDLLAPGRRHVFLRDSKILTYLSEIEEAEIAELERGAYPAVEALAFAVIEMRQAVARQKRTAHIPDGNVWSPQDTTNVWGSGNPIDRFLRGSSVWN